jgi:dimethylargininase
VRRGERETGRRYHVARMSSLMAVTRAVSPQMGACQLTHVPRVPIDVALAAEQHAAYERTLEQLGCTIHRLPAGADMPDSVFIEDTAVVLDEISIIMRPGAASRRGETTAVEEWLKHRILIGRIEPPATMDGGDVMVVGRSIFVGASSRTSQAGLDQFRAIVEYFGYSMTIIEVRGCLHLKSAVSAAGEETLLINPRWVSADRFAEYRLVAVHPEEQLAANVMRVGEDLVYSAAYPRTLECLVGVGARVTTVDVSELAKAEGAVTCCSLIMNSAL